MKKIQLLMAFTVILLSTSMLCASGDNSADDEYDEDTYGPKAPIVWTKPVKSVVFDHKVHTMTAELDCDSCHDELFEMEAGAAEQNDDFTMEKLYEGGYCGACHDGATAFASNTRCTACHIGARGHARLQGAPAEEKAH